MNYRPLRDGILVKPIERIKSDIIQVVMTEKPNLGEIVAVGKGLADKRGNIKPMAVKVGDVIRFGHMGKDEYLSYPELTIEGEKYLVMRELDVCWVNEAA